MKLKTLFALAALTMTIAGCATIDISSRNAPFEVPGATNAATQMVIRDYDVREVRVVVPQNLRSSESNGYYPLTDIVWRGDPLGNRLQQVGEILQTAAMRGTSDLDGAVPVVAEITLVRWHGVTERTRYSVGGVYSIQFYLEVRHAETGAIIEAARLIEANLPAPGGQAAVALEQAGQTEKVRVTDHLTWVFGQELGVADPA